MSKFDEVLFEVRGISKREAEVYVEQLVKAIVGLDMLDRVFD